MLSTPSGIDLRSWQTECLSTLSNKINAGRSHFTVVATMGSGKTFLQGAFARYLLDKGLIDLVINLVPSDTLRTNNTKELREHFNINLSTKLPKEGDVVDGYATTYQMLSWETNVKQLLTHTIHSGKRFLLLADEVHHGSSKKESAWGKGLSTLVDASTFSLMLSGTMWRSDKLRIAGVRYKEVSTDKYEVDPDFCYSLKDATDDNVVSKVFFNEVSAQIKINTTLSSDDDEYDLGESDVTFNRNHLTKKAERTFKHLVNPKGSFCKHLLEEAHTALTAMVRNHNLTHKDVLPPAGLVVASSCEAAGQIAELLKEISGEEPLIVHTGIPASRQLIHKFASGELTNNWIVSVGMVSEGVDVPRVKVLAYLTTARTELVFHQIIGRTMRVRRAACGANINEPAMVYIPATPRLHGHVSNFVLEQSPVAIDPRQPKKRKPRQPSQTVKEETILLDSKPVGPIEMFLNGAMVNYEDIFKQLTLAYEKAIDTLNTSILYPASNS